MVIVYHSNSKRLTNSIIARIYWRVKHHERYHRA